MARIAHSLVAACVLLAVAGCGGRRLTAEESFAAALKAATGPSGMWYHFSFEAVYRGKPFKIEQLVTCQSRVISGGSLGQSPDTVVSEGHPKTAAAKMQDGSQILVRIPNMCRRYRAYATEPGVAGVHFIKGWRSPGPHAVIPLVTWSDNVTAPEQIESYVAADYYTQREARLRHPKGSLVFWPAGKIPANAEAILRQKDALPFYPHPNVNPALGEASRGGGRDGHYHGAWPQFSAFVIVPTNDPEDAWSKYDRLLPKAAQHDAPLSKPALETADIRWHDWIDQDYDYPYVSGDCLWRSLAKLLAGAPAMSAFLYDPEDHASAYPIHARMPGQQVQTPENLDRVERLESKMRLCYAQLGKLRSLDIVDGRLDPARATPGIIVYRKWGSNAASERPRSKPNNVLIERGAADSDGIRYRIEGVEFSRYPLPYGALLKLKASGEWYYLARITEMFGAEGENGGFNY